jgi:catechol 2,3-dioxygenase-like lactoylglutathione lyase family enzyme
MSNGEFRFVFYARDYENTVGFYRDGLGLPIVGGWDRGIGDRGTLFSAAGGIIEAISARGRDFAPPVGLWPIPGGRR